jgi:ABC-2 type transport system permease protein
MGIARLTWRFLRVAIQNELQYHVHFWFSLFQSAVSLVAGLVVIALVFQHDDHLAGWSQSELLVVLGVFTAMGGVVRAFIKPNVLQLIEDIRDGTLDYLLAKPVDAQLLVSIRKVQVWQFVDIVVGGLVVSWGLAVGASPVEPATLGAALLLFVVGALALYSILLVAATSAFWFTRVDEFIDVFDGLFHAGRYPVGVYPGWLRIGLTALAPIGVAITVPAEALAGRLTTTTLLTLTAATGAWLGLARLLWKAGLRRYSGASA